MEYKVKEIVEPSKYAIEEEKNAPSQYKEIKKKHPECVILFRIGDFYEAYCDDAETCSEVLGITLSYFGENRLYRMASFHHYNLDTFLPKLIRAGKRVAICEKIEEKKKTIKDIIKQ